VSRAPSASVFIRLASSRSAARRDWRTYASQILWLALAFGLLYYLMSRIALPRIAGILHDRQSDMGSSMRVPVWPAGGWDCAIVSSGSSGRRSALWRFAV
jgi:hypothetical protein